MTSWQRIWILSELLIHALWLQPGGGGAAPNPPALFFSSAAGRTVKESGAGLTNVQNRNCLAGVGVFKIYDINDI